MSRFYSYLNTATSLISQFDGSVPLAIFLKHFFSREKKFGSKDRKQISALMYNYYRVANAIVGSSIQDKVLIAIFICENSPSEILALFIPEYNLNISKSFNEKLELVGDKIDLSKIFPFENELSTVINKDKFRQSLLVQPNLFLRLRPGRKEKTLKLLTENQINFEEIRPNTICLKNGIKVPDTILIDKDYVVQDSSSQKIGELFAPFLVQMQKELNVWDCCAASGGKSIMLYDQNLKLKLYVSDIRSSILINLEERFKAAGIKNYTKFVADLTEKKLTLPSNKFDVIIADVPCTGSGTWSRTPEQMYFFNSNQLNDFALRQKEIAINSLQYLAQNGLLIYITCSVFNKENEEIVSILKDKNMELLLQETVQGYEDKADTLFVAILRKK